MTKGTKEQTNAIEKKYSKSAFIDAAKDSKERLLINALLQDNVTYTRNDVKQKIAEWKTKEVKA